MIDKKVCVGSGFLALDIVLNGKVESPIKFFAGGTCGNVIAILSFLGWSSFPIARLAKNKYTDLLLKDLVNCKVKTDYVTKTQDGSTALIIHRIKKNKDGKPIHRFEFKWPKTKEWLPSYKPVLARSIDKYKNLTPTVFFFDKVNRSSIELAKYYKQNGSLIYFEPSSIKDEKMFLECIHVANIVKYSNERIKSFVTLVPKGIADLEIETLGHEGIKYRTKNKIHWKKLKPFYLKNIIDAAGAGDWFSAGIINRIGVSNISDIPDTSLEKILKQGQAIASLSCLFEGARGLMYSVTYDKIGQYVLKILKGEKFNINHITNNKNHIVNKSIINDFV